MYVNPNLPIHPHTPHLLPPALFRAFNEPVLLDTAASAKSLQSCPTLWDPIDSSPPGSAVPGILQARTLEWVAISFSIAWKWKVKGKSLSRVRLFATPWTAAYQAPLPMGFSRQKYWSGVPLLSLLLDTRSWNKGFSLDWPLLLKGENTYLSFFWHSNRLDLCWLWIRLST